MKKTRKTRLDRKFSRSLKVIASSYRAGRAPLASATRKCSSCNSETSLSRRCGGFGDTSKGIQDIQRAYSVPILGVCGGSAVGILQRIWNRIAWRDARLSVLNRETILKPHSINALSTIEQEDQLSGNATMQTCVPLRADHRPGAICSECTSVHFRLCIRETRTRLTASTFIGIDGDLHTSRQQSAAAIEGDVLGGIKTKTRHGGDSIIRAG